MKRHTGTAPTTGRATAEGTRGAPALNRQSTLEPEDFRRVQLLEVTIDSLAEVGYVGSTLAQIASRADVSPGLVAHYFDDKDGLLEAAFRTLSRRLFEQMDVRMRLAHTPRGRIQAIIDTNLGPQEVTQRTGAAWRAFWGQVPHVEGLKRVQNAYQRRMVSNLRYALVRLLPATEARSLASIIAAMIDGVWLRAALSNWAEADSESERNLLTAFVDARLGERRRDSAPVAGAPPVIRARDSFQTFNPATGEVLASIRVSTASDIDAAVEAASKAQREWAMRTGAGRG